MDEPSSRHDGVRRLAQALSAPAVGADDHARCRQEMAAMAEAELRGERPATRFPTSVQHLDICESCSLEYAELLDLLLDMEAFAGQPATSPALPSAMLVALRIRDWVARAAHMVLGAAHTTAEEIEVSMQSLLENLASRNTLPGPVQAQQWALGYGSEDEETPLLLATWFTTQTLAQRDSVAELTALASRGQLTPHARRLAESTATQMQLERTLRVRFVAAYVASVEADPDAFVALGRPDRGVTGDDAA